MHVYNEPVFAVPASGGVDLIGLAVAIVLAVVLVGVGSWLFSALRSGRERRKRR